MRQPQGVHGLSRVYDQNAFAWSDTGFQPRPLSSAVIYELHIGTFTTEGTLDGAIAKLDELVNLGITHVELMPVAAFDGVHGWGYDGVALFAVHQPYGGPDALKRFVDAAHAKGLAVLLDVVYNHFGPSGNYAGKFGPYITDAHHTPWGGAVNLEGPWSHQVRRFFLDNALMWMRDFHIDGLRLDAVHAYVDRSAIHFLEQLATETRTLEAALGRRKVLIAESDSNDPRIVSAPEAGGFGIDAQWSDDFHHALFAVLDARAAAGILHRLRINRDNLRRRWSTRSCMTGSTRTIESACTENRRSAFRNTISSGTSRTTIRWGIAPSAIACTRTPASNAPW